MPKWAGEQRTEMRANMSQNQEDALGGHSGGSRFMPVINEKHLHIEPVVASHGHYCRQREKVLKFTSVLDISAAWQSREAPSSLLLTNGHSSKQYSRRIEVFLQGNDSRLATVCAVAK